MATKFDLNNPNRYSHTGYEGQNFPDDYIIPSCGVEDLDKSVFELFDKQIPLYYDLHGEKKRVPVIFATGERFALLRRKKPIVDKNGALILPLISITRGAIDNVPQKGIANNQMFPHVITKRLSQKDLVNRQLNNYENLKNINGEDKDVDPDLSLVPRLDRNIIETIEMPAVKYFSTTYEISIWSSFTQQMNKMLEAIMSSYTLNPGQQIRLDTDKGYWFSAFIDTAFSQDTNYADFTDAERYIKYNMSINATGYIIAPNIEGGKTALRSFMSAPEVSFDFYEEPINLSDNVGGPVTDPNPEAHVFDDLATEDTISPSQMIGIDGYNNMQNLRDDSSIGGYGISENASSDEVIGQQRTNHTKTRKTYITTSDGQVIPVQAKTSSGRGEMVYDAKFAEYLFSVDNKK